MVNLKIDALALRHGAVLTGFVFVADVAADAFVRIGHRAPLLLLVELTGYGFKFFYAGLKICNLSVCFRRVACADLNFH
jgi:hypothetical protein